MALLGSIIALGAALVFAALAGLLTWGAWQTLRDEVLPGFVSARPAPADRALTIILTVAPLAGAALLALLASGRILMVAIGM